MEEWERVNEEKSRSRGLGWVLNWGKKAVITGMVVTSLPLVIPPLMVISAVGLGVWVPYGVILASYVGTERVMSKLLPLPAPIHRIDDEKMSRSLSSMEESRKRKRTEEDAIRVGEMSMQQYEESVSVCIEGGGILSDTIQNKEEVVIIDGDGDDDGGLEVVISNVSVEEADAAVGGEDAEEVDKHHHNDVDLPNDKELSTDNWPKEDANANANGDQQQQSTPKEKQDVPVPPDSKQGVDDDDEIWKKLDAIRGIVGIKTPRQPSYLEELNAFYLFTGIQPPSHLSHFNAKLTFLMTVIGLK